MFTHYLTYELRRSSAETLTKTQAVEGDLAEDVDVTIPGETPDVEVDFEFFLTRGVMLYIVAHGALTLETNDGAAPDDTIVLAANSPVVWTSAAGNPPFTVDVAKLFVSNAGVAAVLLQIRSLSDATP